MKGLFIPKGRNTFCFQRMIHGKRVKLRLGTRDEDEAVRRAIKILSSPEMQPPEPWKTELDRYFSEKRREDRLSKNSVAGRRVVLTKFLRGLNRLSLASITTSDVQNWYDSLSHLEEQTRQGYVRWLGAFFKHLISRHKLRTNPVAGIRMARLRPKARKSVLTREEVSTLIDNCEDQELKFALYCGFHAGMRKEEVIEARPEWFDFSNPEQPQIHIGPTATWIPKDRERRSVPITKPFAAFLRGYGLPSPYMIAPTKAQGLHRYRFDFRRRFQKRLDQCGIRSSFHDARRTFASLLVSAGVSVYKVARWLGDGVAVVEKHYGHLQADNGDIDRLS